MQSIARQSITMFNNHKPYEVKRAKREKGPLNQQRKRVIRATKTANAPHAFANSKFKKRREHRLKRQLESMVIITCGDELDLPLGKADYPIYYVDDTEGANAERPIMDRYWTPGSVLHDFEMMDEPSHREKGFKIYSKNGRLICYKLSDVKRTGITVDDWKEHYEVLKEALDVQPNNPRGNRKIGKYKNYIMRRCIGPLAMLTMTFFTPCCLVTTRLLPTSLGKMRFYFTFCSRQLERPCRCEAPTSSSSTRRFHIAHQTIALRKPSPCRCLRVRRQPLLR